MWALGPAQVLQTTAEDGDVGRDAPGGEHRRLGLTGSAWSSVHQVHGSTVAVFERSVGRTEIDADGIVTAAPDVPLAIFGADCALVGLASPEGVIAVVHAGWRGLADGVIAAVTATMRALGATEIDAAVGPMIHPECYAFGAEDLDRVAGLLGDGVRSVTSGGEMALDLPRGVADALLAEGVVVRHTLGGCTACEGGWYSYRARGEITRHALVISRASDVARGREVPRRGAQRREHLSRDHLSREHLGR